MKRIILILVLLTGAIALNAQSHEEGKQHFYYERYASAAASFQAVADQQPANAGNLYWLTKAYLAQNDIAKAEAVLNKASSLQNDPWYNVAYGSLMLHKKGQAEAAPYFNKALEATNEKDLAILAEIADAHTVAKAGNANYAIGLLDKAIKKDKKNAGLHIKLGNAWRKLHNGTEAYKAYTAAIEYDSRSAEAYYLLGRIFLSQKNTELYLENFNKAIAVDANYAPAIHEMYRHYLYTDPAKSMTYFKQYQPLSDQSVGNAYSYTDLLYLTKDYNQAISNANALIASEGSAVQPRLYKLLAYSYEGMKDTARAMDYMRQYFMNEHDSNFVAKDFETMGDLYAASEGKEDSAMIYYEKLLNTMKDATAQPAYYKKLAGLAALTKDFASEAKWLGKYYTTSPRTTNVDLFNWGYSLYRAENYAQADSVFGTYAVKFPEQGHGYYWQARSNAAIDSAMEQGLAIPHYQKLIEVVGTDSVNAVYKKWLVEAYGYLAAYETNTEKDYAEAIDYFEKLLEIDPANDDAKKYVAILEKSLEKESNKKP
jgi:tetratricopeptide (TPR) repeat protein